MDVITQAALGATMGALIAGRQLGRPALGWGILWAWIPSLDAVLLPFLDTVWDLRIQRAVFHSVVVLGAIAWALAKPLGKRWKKKKISPARAGWWVFLGASGSVLLDSFTVEGTQFLWPVVRHPWSFANLPAVDPWFSLPLLVAAGRWWFVEPKLWKKAEGRRFALICLGISASYLGLSFWAKSSVSQAALADLGKRGVALQRKIEVPAPYSILLWRVVIQHDDELWVSYRSLLDGERPMLWTIFPRREAALEAWSKRPEVRTFRAVTQDWCVARDRPSGVWLIDARQGESRTWDSRGLQLRPDPGWDVRKETKGDPMKKTEPQERHSKLMLERMWHRILGDQEGWEDRARLIGNPGAPQEYLGALH
ncbi:metal-dependent hydrolase [Haloferula luteola]